MSDKPKRMIFDLEQEDREALERVRAKLGFRSHAETLRELIRHHDGAQDQGPLGGDLLRSKIAAGMPMDEYNARVVPAALSRAAYGPATKLNLQVGPAVRKPGDLMKKGSKK